MIFVHMNVNATHTTFAVHSGRERGWVRSVGIKSAKRNLKNRRELFQPYKIVIRCVYILSIHIPFDTLTEIRFAKNLYQADEK